MTTSYPPSSPPPLLPLSPTAKILFIMGQKACAWTAVPFFLKQLLKEKHKQPYDIKVASNLVTKRDSYNFSLSRWLLYIQVLTIMSRLCRTNSTVLIFDFWFFFYFWFFFALVYDCVGGATVCLFSHQRSFYQSLRNRERESLSPLSFLVHE